MVSKEAFKIMAKKLDEDYGTEWRKDRKIVRKLKLAASVSCRMSKAK